MNRKVVAIASAALLVGSATAAAAHHSTAQYDNTHPMEVKGVVKDFAPSNPHMQLTLMVNDAKGPHTVELEGQSVNNLYRLGYRRGMINVGDTVTVSFSPLKAGLTGYAGLFRSITMADGHTLGTLPQAPGNARPPA